MEVKKQNSYFVIPLNYQNKYDVLCNAVEKSGVWVLNTFSRETELHSYVHNIFTEKGCARAYKLDKNLGKKYGAFTKICYQNLDIVFSICDVELYLFDTKIAFLLYGVEYDTPISLEKMITANYYMKQLFEDGQAFYLLDRDITVDATEDSLKFLRDKKPGIIKTNPEIKNEMQTIRLIYDTDSYLEVKTRIFLNKKTNEYIKAQDNCHFKYESKNKIHLFLENPFSLIEMFTNILNDIGFLNGKFFASSDKHILPKKALLCNSVYIDSNLEDTKETNSDLFHLSLGYNQSYKYYENCCMSRLQYFDNSIWGIGREGIANINFKTEDTVTNNFFENELSFRFKNIYCFLYIIILHQYYGLKYFTALSLESYNSRKEISEEKCTNYHRSKEKKEYNQHYKNICNIKKASEAFYLKFVYTDVSQISHQNDFYKEIYKKYNIDELIKDFRENIDMSNTIMNNEYQKSTNKKVNVLVWITAILGAYEVVKNIKEMVVSLGQTLGVSSLILLLVLCCTVTLLTVYFYFIKKH